MKEFLGYQGHGSLPFVGSKQLGADHKSVARAMRAALDLKENWAEGLASWEEALRLLRERVELAGLLIFTNGVVGNSTRRKLDPDEFQGFVFVDPIAPLVFINGADFKVAQMFTIAHEL